MKIHCKNYSNYGIKGLCTLCGTIHIMSLKPINKKQTMKTFKELLNKDNFNACNDAVIWAKYMTIEEVVTICHRGDWLLWLAQKVDVDIRPLTLAKGYCVKTVIHLMKNEKSINAVNIAISFGNGIVTKSDLIAAADAANAAAYATANAAYAAIYAADTAKVKNQLETANICRKYIGQLIIDKVNELLNK